MSDLTKRLREQLTMSKFTNRAYLYARMDDDRRVAADRIEALEECLREFRKAAKVIATGDLSTALIVSEIVARADALLEEK